MGSDWCSANSAEKYAIVDFVASACVWLHQESCDARAARWSRTASSYSARNARSRLICSSRSGAICRSIATGLWAEERQSG